MGFASLNVQEVKLSYYLGSVEAPLAVIVVCSFALGGLFGAIAVTGWVFRLKRENNKLTRSIRSSEKELTSLRSLSLRD